MLLRYGGIFSNHFIANFPQSVPVKEFLKSISQVLHLSVLNFTLGDDAKIICRVNVYVLNKETVTAERRGWH